MNLDIHICPTNLLTQKQLQEIADLTTFCHRHDGIELSYPVEEEHHTHFLGYLADGRLAACLTLISYEEPLAECCAFTHPEFRRQGFFSRLLDEAVSLILMLICSSRFPKTARMPSKRWRPLELKKILMNI